ncbi:hypothetical protein [Entomomonas asaccharolytica]|uniref:Uncharacterized protein n=1 Tax=Entomomonas asaccharolytica TaxID=2785331 RepID=A0A974NIE1_9GAMM|nr:hypothetical protein [Entomomonas asaccharolytica]QQP86957.1 hypothetical protein JHT90_06845 [Entomomonas asaccharolytica]
MAEQLVDLYTEEAMRSILTAWYPGEGENWPINDDVTFAVFKIIEGSQNCSSDIHKVPSPAGPIGTARSVTAIGMGYIKKVIKHANDDKHYLMCIKSAAWKMKSDVKMKAYGI